MSSLGKTIGPRLEGALTATTAGSTVNLSWPAATDAVGSASYTLTRTPAFAAAVTTTDLSYADTSASGNPVYAVTVTDARGLTSHPALTAGVTLGTTSELPAFNTATPTKYVAASGNYLGNTAYTTFAAANAAAVPGDVIAVAPGTYTQTALITTSGTALAPITWRAADPLNKPVIDGGYVRPIGWNESGFAAGSNALVWIAASHVVWDSIDVLNSKNHCLIVGPATNNGNFIANINEWYSTVKVLRCNLSGAFDTGFTTFNVDGAYVGGCTILDTQRRVYRADGNLSGWGMGVLMMGRNGSLIECTVGQASGEGIHAGHHISFGAGAHIQAENLTIRKCIVFDTWSALLYVTNVDGGTFDRNLFFKTNDTRYWQFAGAGYPKTGVEFGSESGSFGNPPGSNGLIGSRNVAFTNNVITGCTRNLYFSDWTGQTFSNITLAHNTIFRVVGGSFPGGGTCLRNAQTNLTSVTFRNNLIFDASGRVCDNWNSMLGTNVNSHNLWSHAPPANISGSSQVVTTSPGLNNAAYAVTNTYPAVPTFNTDVFRITGASAANNAGIALAGVTVDYFGNARTSADIGAHTVN